MIARVWSKKFTQQMIRDLRKAGYNVERTNDGYALYFRGEVIFRAMNGRSTYLVRYDEKLLTEDK